MKKLIKRFNEWGARHLVLLKSLVFIFLFVFVSNMINIGIMPNVLVKQTPVELCKEKGLNSSIVYSRANPASQDQGYQTLFRLTSDDCQVRKLSTLYMPVCGSNLSGGYWVDQVMVKQPLSRFNRYLSYPLFFALEEHQTGCLVLGPDVILINEVTAKLSKP